MSNQTKNLKKNYQKLFRVSLTEIDGDSLYGKQILVKK